MGRHSRYTIGDWRAVKRALRDGATIREAAASAGVGRQTAFEWSRRDRPPEGILMTAGAQAAGLGARERSPRARLDFHDRSVIHAMLLGGHGAAAIARSVGVAPSTVYREIARNGGAAGYDPWRADERAGRMARRPKRRRLEEDAVLRAVVVAGLLRKWSPRQISERMRLDFPDNGAMRVSHETIYRAIYVQGRGSLREELACEQALRSGRTRRRPRSKMPPKSGKRWVEGCEISRRPPEAGDRAVPGHWEGDLVVGGDGRSCLVTLVERKTRWLEMRRLTAHETRTVVGLLCEMVGEVPEGVRRALMSTLTWGQGCEMASHADFTRATGFKVYFCDPHSPWQRPTNENTNGLIRQFFPKGTEFADVTDEQVREAQDLLNGRPREVLGWRTPAEAIAEVLAEENGKLQ